MDLVGLELKPRLTIREPQYQPRLHPGSKRQAQANHDQEKEDTEAEKNTFFCSHREKKLRPGKKVASIE